MQDDTQYPILVISLADDIARRAAIQKQLEAWGFAFRFVDAVDGRAGIAPEFEALLDRRSTERNIARQLSDREYACALSHRKAYEEITTHGLPGAIVLEDDAILEDRFRAFVETRAYLSEPMILLYHTFTRILRGSEKPFGALGRLGRIANLPRGAVGYSLDANAARQLLQATTPIRRDADWPTDLHPLGAWALCPCAISHPPQTLEQSNLEEERDQLRRQQGRKSFGRLFTPLYWRTRISVRYCR